MISKSCDLSLLSEIIQIIISDNQVMQYLPIIPGDYLGSIIVSGLGHSMIYANNLYIVLNIQVSIIRLALISGKYSFISSYFSYLS